MLMFLPFYYNSLISLLIFFFLFINFFLVKNFSFFKFIIFSFFNLIKLELKPSLNNYLSKGELIMFLSIFLLILNMNFLSLFPNLFAFSSQLYMNLIMALSFFFMLIMISLSQNKKIILSHISPKGSPLILLSILVLIESFSWLIRPFTLSIRLSANILAGHILLSLVSSLMMKGTLILLMFFFLEMFVSFIQAYVFSLLLLSYKLDVSL